MLNIRQLYLAWSCTLGWLASYPQLPHVHPWNNCEICKMFTKTIIRQVTALFTPRSNEQFSILSALYFLQFQIREFGLKESYFPYLMVFFLFFTPCHLSGLKSLDLVISSYLVISGRKRIKELYLNASSDSAYHFLKTSI